MYSAPFLSSSLADLLEAIIHITWQMFRRLLYADLPFRITIEKETSSNRLLLP